MAGISSKAAGSLINRKKYNGIEFDDDLDINIYEAFFRSLDPQTGKWWQIDPEVEGQESLSPYNSMANDPILRSDPLGDVPENSQEYSEVESNESSENCCPVTVEMWQAVRQSIVSQGPIVGRAIAFAAAVATVATIIYDLAPSQAEIDAANAYNAKVGASIQTGPSYTMGTTPSLTITPPKPAVPNVVQTQKKDPKDLVGDAKAQQQKEADAKARSEKRQAATLAGKQKTGQSNTEVRGNHTKGKQTSAGEKANARRAKEQKAADAKKTKKKKEGT